MSQKKVSKMLFSKERIELSLVENFIAEVNEANKKSDLAIDEIIGVKKTLIKAKADLDKVQNSIKTLKTGQGRIKKMYDELGVEPDSKLEFAFKKRLNVEFEVDELIKKLNGLIGMI